MDQSNKVKRFSDFVSNMKRVLNHFEFRGTIKGGLFTKTKEFDINIYYTPLKMKIVELKVENIDEDTLPFKVGDDISIARKWCNDNKCNVILDIKKL